MATLPALTVNLRAIIPSQEDMEAMARRRYQKPNVLRTKGKRPQWYFRARVDVLAGPGHLERREQFYYLGFCDEKGKRAAEKERDAILGEVINKPQVLLQSQVKFADVVAAYKRDHIPTLREVSARSYVSKIDRWIVPHFKDSRLCDITPQAAQAWINTLPETAKMRKAIVGHFEAIWKKARAWGYTQHATPTEGASLGRVRSGFQRVIPTPEQYLAMKVRLPELLQDMADVAVFTGMRVSEIRGLPVRSVDLAAGVLRVEQRKDALGYIEDPKTDKGRRVLPLGNLVDRLRARVAGKGPEDLVFADCGSYEFAQEHLRDAAKDAGFVSRGFGWHSLRRCHNTWFRKSGGSRDDAKAQMGHSTDAVNDLYLIAETEDFERRKKLVLKLQEQIMGKPQGGIA